MTSYYVVEPEVAGGWGENTIFTRTPGQGTVVHKLHYEFDGWLGDELLESAPCFIVTERMAHEIQKAGLTGVSFDKVEVTVSPEFKQLYPDRQLPTFVWLKIEGTPGRDDFGVTSDLMLVVSESALEVLNRVGIANAAVAPFEQAEPS